MSCFAEKNSVPIVASNIYLRNAKPLPFATKYLVKKVKGVKTGFLSLYLPERNMNRAKTLDYYRVEKPGYELSKTLSDLKKRGVKLTIAVVYAAGTSNEIASLISQIPSQPDITLIVDTLHGEKMPATCKNRFCFLSSKKGVLSKIILSLPRKSRKIKKAELAKFPSGEIKNSPYSRIEKERIKKANAILETAIGYCREDFPKIEQNFYSPLADWLAYSIRKYSAAKISIFVANKERGLGKGALRKKDIYALADMNSVLTYVKIKGRDIEKIIRENLKKGLGHSNIRVVLKNGDIKRIEILKYPLVENHVYKLAMPSFMLENPSYHVIQHAVEFVYTKRKIVDILEKSVRNSGEIYRPEASIMFND